MFCISVVRLYTWFDCVGVDANAEEGAGSIMIYGISQKRGMVVWWLV